MILSPRKAKRSTDFWSAAAPTAGAEKTATPAHARLSGERMADEPGAALNAPSDPPVVDSACLHEEKGGVPLQRIAA